MLLKVMEKQMKKENPKKRYKNKILWKDSLVVIVSISLVVSILLVCSIILFFFYPTPPGFTDLALSLLILLSLGFHFFARSVKRGYKRAFILLVCISIILVISYLLDNIFSFVPNSPPISLSLAFLFSLILYLNARLRLTFITKDGIFMGNVYFGSEQDIILRRRPMFLAWVEIRRIEIKRKEKTVGRGASILNDYLIIKTKDGKTIDCLLFDKAGFFHILHILGEQDLLS